MQLRSLKHHAANALPASWVTYLRKRKRQQAAAQRARARAQAIARHGQVGSTELVTALQGMGVEPGGVLFVQSSFNDLHTFAGRPIDLLAALRSLAGPGGTLMMPAYTADAASSVAQPLDVAHLPTYTGIVNELFRRSPGVLRSVHPRHSICAQGPLAEQLLVGHELCLFADGTGSPFDRLRQRDDATILTLGLPRGFTSFLHWIEDIEPSRLPHPVHQSEPRHYVVQHPDGRVLGVQDMQLRPEVAARLDLRRIAAALDGGVLRWQEYKGMALGVYRVRALSETLVRLRDRGLFHYH